MAGGGRRELGIPDACVLHSLRHTYLTRLGESGVDAFTLRLIAGHASITTGQRYMHPQVQVQALERALMVPTKAPTAAKSRVRAERGPGGASN